MGDRDAVLLDPYTGNTYPVFPVKTPSAHSMGKFRLVRLGAAVFRLPVRTLAWGAQYHRSHHPIGRTRLHNRLASVTEASNQLPRLNGFPLEHKRVIETWCSTLTVLFSFQFLYTRTLMSNTLESLKKLTTVVADTGDFESIKAFNPRDATTNPSLILKAIQKDEYKPLFIETVKKVARDTSESGASLVDLAIDDVLVAFGMEILQIVPGRVSTEVDARLSFDAQASIQKARDLIALYEAKGIDRDRILIKLASTWEGIVAARQLQAEGINCNMTLLFCMAQAIACAQVGAKLISPFVGRILDWHKAKTGQSYTAETDPGVVSVKAIYNYYKKFGHQTEVMGASFRNSGEILELAGCDLLTISPNLLEELAKGTAPVSAKLTEAGAQQAAMEKISLDEAGFRWALNEDQMATEKLSDGIRIFGQDMLKVRAMVTEVLKAG